jgi:hypothetical protein
MWSATIPYLQIVWDATSYKYLLECPRKYQYAILLGYKGTGVHIEFGQHFASAVEAFKKARLHGKSKAQATNSALRSVIFKTWDANGPWGGQYLTMWRCEGTTSYRNSKGNKAKCPWSHKNHWFPSPAPDVCGTCGSDIQTDRRWVPGDNLKHRVSLVRLVAGYCDDQPEDLTDGFNPWSFPNGKPAVELSVRMVLPWQAPSGEPYILAGYFDSIMQFGDEKFVSDNKTTKNALDGKYWAQWAPHVQVDTYDLLGAVQFQDINVKGVVIEGAQVLVGGDRFAKMPFYGSDPRREEYLKDFRYWLSKAEDFARDNYWPMNRASCFGCQFKKVCTMDPGPHRQGTLDANFKVQHWNPLEDRT